MPEKKPSSPAVSRPELLVPAGNPENLRSALLYGADAVYLGGGAHNLRASSAGFDRKQLGQAVRDAELAGAKVYYCLNSLARQDSLAALPGVIEEAAEAGVHALIIADPGVLRLAVRHAPRLPVHLSTQANTSNSESAAFWQEQGVSRVNLARELSCLEIADIRRACPDLELEVFVHGAMCLAVSGHCLLSAWLNDRSGNRGRCTQPCRFEYRATAVGLKREPSAQIVKELVLEEKKRPGLDTWRLREAGEFSEFFAPEDLCLLPYLPWLAGMGVDSLKIEGRMKSSTYVAHVADVYSTALGRIDAARALLPDNPAAVEPEDLLSQFGGRELFEDMLVAAGRPMGSGFFLPGGRRVLAKREDLRQAAAKRPILGRVRGQLGANSWLVDVRHNWDAEKPVELMLPGLLRPLLQPGDYGLENEAGEMKSFVGNGCTAVFKTDDDRIAQGIFIRGGGVY